MLCLAAVRSAFGCLVLGEPARTWEAERFDWERRFGSDRSVDEPEKVCESHPESLEGNSENPLVDEFDDDKMSTAAAVFVRERGRAFEGGSMMTGGSTSSGSGGELIVSEAEGRGDAGLSGLRCLRLKSLLVFLAIGFDLPLLLLSTTTLGDDDGEDGRPPAAPA